MTPRLPNAAKEYANHPGQWWNAQRMGFMCSEVREIARQAWMAGWNVAYWDLAEQGPRKVPKAPGPPASPEFIPGAYGIAEWEQSDEGKACMEREAKRRAKRLRDHRKARSA